jgi:hypothetical protein
MLHKLPVAAPGVVGAPAPEVAANPYGLLFDPGFSAAQNPSAEPGRLPIASAPKVAADPYGALFDPGFSVGAARLSAAQPPAAGSSAQPAPPARKQTASAPDEAAPLPPPRPGLVASPAASPVAVRRVAPSGRGAPGLAAAPPDNRNLFEKLFGIGKRSGPALAYASADSGLAHANSGLLRAQGDASGPSTRYDRWTAVYDLAAHTVYLPDGTRLEAHSGLGGRLDDPAHVDEQNRGATPPHVYELKPREQLFHGVQALRLDPVGGGDIFGRAGLLAHSYMLGPNGDSNGCVSFKDYDAFLRAFQNGQVKRLAVVARLD